MIGHSAIGAGVTIEGDRFIHTCAHGVSKIDGPLSYQPIMSMVSKGMVPEGTIDGPLSDRENFSVVLRPPWSDMNMVTVSRPATHRLTRIKGCSKKTKNIKNY